MREYNRDLRKLIAANDRTEFPCFHLCAACGRLHETPDACPTCGSVFSVDLGLEQAFLALQESRDMAVEVRHSIRLRRSMFAAAVFSALAFSGGMAAYALADLYITGLMGVSMVTGLGAAFGAALTGPPVSERSYEPRRPQPLLQWRAPNGPVSPTGKGTVLGRGMPQRVVPMHSPLTGARCLGYVGKVIDARGRIRLISHTNVAMDLRSHQLDADGAHLRVQMSEVDQSGPRRAAIKQWCRARGVDIVDDDFQVFEGHIPADAPVVVARHASGLTLEQDSAVARDGYRG